jgi:ribose transport system substrate-binding protein
MKRLVAVTAMLVVVGLTASAVAQSPNFDDPAEFEKQRAMLEATASGPEGEPWLQHFGDEMADTSQYAKE